MLRLLLYLYKLVLITIGDKYASSIYNANSAIYLFVFRFC